jgi:hypothetical protein
MSHHIMGSRGIKSLKPIRHVSDLFPSTKSYKAFQALAEEMKTRGNRMTTNAVSEMSKRMHKEKIYNRANFYWYVLEPLVELGFFERRPFWNDSLKKTQYSYVVVKYDLPRYPISSGYMRDAYFLCREWNEYFFDGSDFQSHVNENNWNKSNPEVTKNISVLVSEDVESTRPKTAQILQRSRPIKN